VGRAAAVASGADQQSCRRGRDEGLQVSGVTHDGCAQPARVEDEAGRRGARTGRRAEEQLDHLRARRDLPREVDAHQLERLSDRPGTDAMDERQCCAQDDAGVLRRGVDEVQGDPRRVALPCDGEPWERGDRRRKPLGALQGTTEVVGADRPEAQQPKRPPGKRVLPQAEDLVVGQGPHRLHDLDGLHLRDAPPVHRDEVRPQPSSSQDLVDVPALPSRQQRRRADQFHRQGPVVRRSRSARGHVDNVATHP